ncbi:MAG: hypothetical protein U0996_08650 [Planctomycetaceae bacterium]
MPQESTADSEIVHLTALQSIRRRPSMYIGDESGKINPNTLVMEALCLAWSNACDRCCSRVSINLADDTVVIWDDGPGLDVFKQLSGSHSLIRAVFTEVHACRDAKVNQSRDLCRVGIAIVTALSRETIYETAQCGFVWRQSFTAEDPNCKLEKLAPTTEQWQRVTVIRDPAIFGPSKFTCDGVIEVHNAASNGLPPYEKNRLPAADVRLTLTDDATNRCVVLNAGVTKC